MKGEISHAAGLVIVDRLQRIKHFSKLFVDRASEAASTALAGREPSSGQLQRINDAIAVSCLKALLLDKDVPSKGALRDAADRAGRAAVEGVI